MREICQSGSEGGGGESLSLPLSMRVTRRKLLSWDLVYGFLTA
jgi:hypothetical protein